MNLFIIPPLFVFLFLPPLSVQVLKNEYGISMENHRSRLLSSEDVDRANLIIPVKKELGNLIQQLYPSAANKLKFFARDVPDPWHQPYEVYAHCARMVDALVQQTFEQVTTAPSL